MKRIVAAVTGTVLMVPRGVKAIISSKYIELILAVGLFILLDTGVLILNFYTSYQIANDAHAIQIAGQMGTMTQRLFQQLYQVQEDSQKPDADYDPTIDALADTYKTFDETLDAFIYGGELIGVGQGQDSLLKDTTYRDTSAHLLIEAEEIWKVYRTKLKPIVYAYFSDAERIDIVKATKAAVAYAREKNDQFLGLVKSFSEAVEGVAQRKAQRLRRIQAVGITLAVINFFLILFHFLRRLRRSDALIERSRQETLDILKNVNEGLFLLDRQGIIGSQHSESLHQFFNSDDLAGRDFISLLQPFVTEKTLATVEDYTEILFSARVNESLIADLNPLKEVEMSMATETADYDVRYFSFQFSRVYDRKEFHALLVTVKDISEQVRLTEQLKAAHERTGKEIATLLTIIHIDNELLDVFLTTTENGLNKVNDVLKNRGKAGAQMQDKLEAIFRIVHKLKGDGTALGLEFVVEKFHAFERVIIELKEKQPVGGEDFLPLVVHLNKLMSEFSLIRDLQKKITTTDNGGLEDGRARSTSKSIWQKQMATLVRQVAADYEKQVNLDMSNFDVTLLEDRQQEAVKDIIVQSLRNAIAHGIEPPLLRESSGKPPEGRLKVVLKKNGNGLELAVRDDGQGIDLERVKAKAVASGLATKEQVASWDRARLLSLLFRQGFSTSRQQGLHAGHGVGMDLIKSRLETLGGKARIRCKTGQYTEFLYNFREASLAA